MIEFRARLPKDEAALVIAAIRTAKDQFGPPPVKPDACGDVQQEATSGIGVYRNVDGLFDVARGFLNTAPEDGSGEDRTLVVVQVGGEPGRKRRRSRSLTGTFPQQRPLLRCVT